MPSDDDPQRAFATEVVRRLQERNFRAFWAGGCVRDLLIGRTPKDYDVATDAHPPAVRELFGHRRTRAVGASFGVVLVLGPLDAGTVEVATFRTEGSYRDGRRPDHVEFSTPEVDAQRRDFTINGMFYDPVADTVLDFVGGKQDLDAGIVRAIGNPRERMAEDKLRLLRAVRFTALMDFQLDPQTAEAVRAMAGEIRIVSAERIAQELQRMLADRHRGRAIELCDSTGLLPEILPELAARWADSGQQASRRLALLQEPSFELAMAALLLAIPNASHASQAIAKRLKMSNYQTERIGWLLEHVAEVSDAKTKSRAALKRLLAHPGAAELISLAKAAAVAGRGDLPAVEHCEEFLQNSSPVELNPPPLITGADLIALQLQPGAAFRRILEAVRDAQLDGEITTKDEAIGLVKRLLKQG